MGGHPSPGSSPRARSCREQLLLGSLDESRRVKAVTKPVLWPAAVAAGLAAESVYYGFNDPTRRIPDLVTGWALIGCGLVAWRHRRGSLGVGVLLNASLGFRRFVGNFARSDLAAVAWIARHGVLLAPRGPLVHAVLVYPTGRNAGLERRWRRWPSDTRSPPSNECGQMNGCPSSSGCSLSVSLCSYITVQSLAERLSTLDSRLGSGCDRSGRRRGCCGPPRFRYRRRRKCLAPRLRSFPVRRRVRCRRAA